MKKLLAVAILTMLASSAFAAPPYHHGHSPQRHHRAPPRHHAPARWHASHHRGQRIDRRYWGTRVVYRNHGLRAPPRGYEWHRSGNDYLLIAVATGIIASVAAAH